MNYERDSTGTLHQKEVEPFVYDHDYNEIYNTELYKKNSWVLSTLRLAFVFSILGLNGSILDVGYGNGDFLRVASLTYEAHGYDISDYTPKDIKRVNSMYGKYDAICFWDSYEHMVDLEFVRSLDCKYAFFSMPYCHYDTMGEDWLMKWKHLKPNEHIHHFTPESLMLQMQKFGYHPFVENNKIENIIRRNPDDELQNIFSAAYYIGRGYK